MKKEFFMVGDVNLYDYQATGFKRFNTMRAAIPDPLANMDPLQARRHLQQREHIRSLKCTLCGGSGHLAKDCKWAKP